jgi:VWFA-related protein
MKTKSLLAPVLFALLAIAGARAQQQTPPPPPETPPAQTPPTESQPPPQPAAQPAEGQEGQQQPTFRTGINFVRVDAVVSDKNGQPVEGLTAQDFEVFEDGRPMRIETFKFLHVTGTPAEGEGPARAITSDWVEESEAARDDVRLFVIFLDDYHVRRGSDLFVRDKLATFIEKDLGPLDMVALMYPLSSLSEVRFTRNKSLAAATLRKFLGRKGDYFPRNEFEERYANYPVYVVERIRNEVSLTALEGLMVRMGGLREGRKSLILVSEGYTNYVPPQHNDPVATMPGYGNPTRRTPTLGGGPEEDRARFMTDLDLNTYLRDVYASANRNNVSIYALDPRGLAAFEYDLSQPGVPLTTDANSLRSTIDKLRVLADETDGRAIVNQNDLQAGLRQMLRDASAHYLLGYTSDSATDGKFHEIKVRVKRKGVDVRARKGFWAYNEADVKRVTESRKAPPPDVSEALAEVERPRRARLVRTWVGMAPRDDGRTDVTLVWEAGAGASGRSGQVADVLVMAAGAKGEPYYRGRSSGAEAASADENVETVESKGEAAVSDQARPATARAGGQVTFAAPPGPLNVRLSAENPSGEVIDSDQLDLQVTDFSAPDVRVSTPAVLRAQNAVEFRAVSGNPGATPTTAREFSRRDRLLIRFDATGPAGGSDVKTTARLLNRTGQAMSDLPVGPAPANGRYRWQVDLPLSSLPAGEFLVEVKAASGERSARELVGFRIGG